MGRVQRKRRKKTIIIIVEIICLIAAGFYVYYIAEKRAEEKERALAEEQKRQEQLAKEKAEKEKKEKDLNQWNLILVNNDNALPDGYNSDVELATIDSSLTSYGGAQVDKRILESFNEMMADCKAESGGTPLLISAYRSTSYQEQLYNSAQNKKDTARPGHSEHECGLAVDIVDSSNQALTDEQENTAVQKWLMANCQDYGFILRYPKDKEDVTEIIYEPWHYRYVGEEHAKEIMKSGVCLEEYIESLKSKLES